MRRLLTLLFALGLLAFACLVWPSRWRYDHITVNQDTYLVRIERLSGHADILVPELGWTPAEAPWDDPAAPREPLQGTGDKL